MQLKTAAKIAIVCLSLSAVTAITSDIWTHRLIVIGAFTDMRTLYQIGFTIQVLLFHLPLIMFFVVLWKRLGAERLQ